MKCIGRTSLKRRCRNNARIFFCHLHGWQSIIPGTFLTFLTVVAIFFPDVFPTFICRFLSREAKYPIITITTRQLSSPQTGEPALTAANLIDRRLHRLEILNPNDSELSNIDLKVQFPEAILNIRNADSTSNIEIKAYPDYEEPSQSRFDGLGTNTPVLEAYDSEPTGLWKLNIKALAPNTPINIEIVSAAGSEGGRYTANALDEQNRIIQERFLWVIHGSYQILRCKKLRRSNMIVPLSFDSTKREFSKNLPIVSGPINKKDWVKFRQSRGFRIPEVFRTKGYIFIIEGLKEGRLVEAPILLERPNDIKVTFGLFGPELQPVYTVEWKNPPKN